MLQDLRTRYGSLFRHVPDEDYRTPRSLGELHKYLGDIPNLCDAPRLRTDIERRYHTYGIDDDKSGIVPLQRFQDILQSMCGKNPDMLARDAKPVRPVGYLMDILFSTDIRGSGSL